MIAERLLKNCFYKHCTIRSKRSKNVSRLASTLLNPSPTRMVLFSSGFFDMIALAIWAAYS